MSEWVNIDRATRGRAAGIEFLRRTGNGKTPPVILLHGIGSNADSFGPLAAALPPSFDVLAWNAPGYSASQPLVAPSPAPRDYAEMLRAMLDAIGISRIMVVGHSLGALFAASFAASYPERVESAVLISPALGYRVRPPMALPADLQARIDELETLGPAAFAQKRAARLVADPQRSPQVLVAVQRAMATVDTKGYTQAVRALGAGDLLKDVACISTPSLVVVGSRDVITPPANARAAHAAFNTTATYREIEGAGHAVTQEEPAATATLLVQLAEATVHA